MKAATPNWNGDSRVKRIPIASSEDSGRVGKQLSREARVAAILAHFKIVPSTLREAHNAFIVMEYVDRPYVNPSCPTPIQKMIRFVRVLPPWGAALDYAHSSGTVCRDIKFGNIIVQDDDTPKILDFGAVHLAGPIAIPRPTMMILYPLSQIAPKALVRGSSDPKANQYSLAVIVYRLVILPITVAGDSLEEMLPGIIRESAPPPHKIILRVQSEIRWRENIRGRIEPAQLARPTETCDCPGSNWMTQANAS